MNCDLFKKDLEDFLYGELDEARSAEMLAHLENCAVCAALREEIDRENESFGRFYEQTSIEPTAEMWEAIRARIASEARARTLIGSGRGWLERLRIGLLAPATLRQAAFAALLVALSVAATTLYLKLGEDGEKNFAGNGEKATPTQAPRQGATPSPSPSNDVVSGGNQNTVAPAPKGAKPSVNRVATPRKLTDQELMNRQIARAELEYQKAIRLLDRAIAKQRDRLDPALIKQYESSLALIDDSIAASRRALRERPDDPTAGQFLLAAYAKKLDLMQDIAMK
jgi:tetratricopeptide (TPR) repeat protein